MKHIIRKLRNKYLSGMLWKRWTFWTKPCDICDRASLLQYEVGLNYWVCRNPWCQQEADVRSLIDLETWQRDQTAGTFDSCEGNIYEYR